MSITDFRFDTSACRKPVIRHEPVRPVRPDVLGEVAFYTEWQDLMAQEPPMGFMVADSHLEIILAALGGQVTQRRATVAASLIKWLGTNCGRSMREEAQRLATLEVAGLGDRAWLKAWAVENRRDLSSNYGDRALEAILAEEFLPDGRVVVPELTMDDYEVAEQLMLWLGSHNGKAYLQRCEQRLRALYAAQEALGGGLVPTAPREAPSLSALQCRHIDKTFPNSRTEMAGYLARGVEVIVRRQNECSPDVPPFAIKVLSNPDFWIDCCASEAEAVLRATALGLRVE
ncbi:hypothetical protein [Geopseudomonas aromaticivorans]